jgi:hypothetical protein
MKELYDCEKCLLLGAVGELNDLLPVRVLGLEYDSLESLYTAHQSSKIRPAAVSLQVAFNTISLCPWHDGNLHSINKYIAKNKRRTECKTVNNLH